MKERLGKYIKKTSETPNLDNVMKNARRKDKQLTVRIKNV